MKQLLLSFLLLSSSTFILGQTKDSLFFDGHQQNIYVGFGSSNGMIGLNYDIRFERGRMDGLGLNLGIGGGWIGGIIINHSISTCTVALNVAIGKERSGLVLGLGIVPTKVQNSVLFTEPETYSTMGAVISAEYRYRQMDKGLYFHIGFCPVMYSNRDLMRIPVSIGVGYAFH